MRILSYEIVDKTLFYIVKKLCYLILTIDDQRFLVI